MAPPISMNTLSAAVEHQAISCPAHCLLSQSDRLWDRRGMPSLRSAMKGGKFADLSSAVAGHPIFQLIQQSLKMLLKKSVNRCT